MTTYKCPNCTWRGPESEVRVEKERETGLDVWVCPVCRGAEVEEAHGLVAAMAGEQGQPEEAPEAV